MKPPSVVLTLLVALGAGAADGVRAADRPVTGTARPDFDPLDAAVVGFMDAIGCQAATAAVSKDGRLLYARGYGWADEAKTTPVPPDALLRIASVTKAVTATAVKTLVRAGRLSLDTKAFEFIGVPTVGREVTDPRLRRITVKHLLAHEGGWDAGATFDPMFRADEVERDLNLKRPAGPADVIEYMRTRPLQFDPGTKTVYSNFGYCVLGRVIERATRKPYAEALDELLFRPAGITDIKLGHGDPARRDPREVWSPGPGGFSLDVMDAHGGLIASAPAVCRFMDAFWLIGDPRLRGRRQEWTYFGSIPGTTAMARQRPDGLNVAVFLNGRREEHYENDSAALQRAVDRALDLLPEARPKDGKPR